MAYKNKFAAAIRVNGKILREYQETVYLPFGSEYQIRLKNLHTVRSLVNVFIDGDNVVPGGLVLSSGQEIDLERAIRNGNLSEGNKFKFIERTQNIEKNRGIKIEDGVIRIEYQFEKVYVSNGQYPYEWKYNCNHDWMYTKGLYQVFNSTACQSMTSNSIESTYEPSKASTSRPIATASVGPRIAQNASTGVLRSFVANDAGITVPGSHSDQSFQTASWFATEVEKHSIVLKLLGETEDNKQVMKPITTKYKPNCVTCGRQNKATAKFCSECGTAMAILV